MNKSLDILSDIAVYTKYAKYIPELKRRETWEEAVYRRIQMDVQKFPNLEKEIYEAYSVVLNKEGLPSMRSIQFAGKPIELNNARMYNCCALPVDSIESFSETMFLLLSGCGVGYSVQYHDICKLPDLIGPSKKTRRYLIGDSIIGWADAVKALMKSYFLNKPLPIFDYSDIRPKGALLITSGGSAPGPAPLKAGLINIQKVLDAAIAERGSGTKLTSLEINDIMCYIADTVLSGGLRRASCICLFSIDDKEMFESKFGDWWDKQPQRARANNSVYMIRHKAKKEDFYYIWDRIKARKTGDPGIYWSNDKYSLVNPCVSGDTEILTIDGYERIDSLVDQTVTIWNGKEWSEVTPKITGYNQPMLKISFSDGRNLKCTDYHKFHIFSNYNGGTKIVNANQLKIGDKLTKYDFPLLGNRNPHSKKYDTDDKYWYTAGFYCADETTGQNFIRLFEPKYSCEKRLEILKGSEKEYETNSGVKYKNLTIVPCGKDKNFVPSNEIYIEDRLSYIAGLLDGDGCELKEGGAQIGSINKEFLLKVQKLLSTVGVNSKVVDGVPEGYRIMPDGKGGTEKYFCKKSYRLCIGATQIQYLIQLGLSCERLSFDKTPQRDASQYTKIVAIERIDNENIVYCFNEPKNHTGIFNGIMTGQCNEASLDPYSFCNLTTVNGSNIINQEDFNNRVRKVAFIGTLQASYTDFHYLRPIWKETTEKNSLLGVSITGIASGELDKINLKEAAKVAVEENKRVAKLIGIRSAKRVTLIKPEGTASIVLKTSSGIHDWYAPYYIRRMRFNKNEAIYKYFKENIPELVEDDFFKPTTDAVVSIPVKAPDGALVTKNSTAISILERIKRFHTEWIKPGHIKGDNTHNVSATVFIKDDEWDEVGEWLWDNRYHYNGVALFKYDSNEYIQAPFEEITKEKFEEMYKYLKDIDLTQIVEEVNTVDHKQIVACAGGKCEI